MKYVPLIVLSLQHDYYTDGRCADFTIRASAETERLLRNHRCVIGGSDDILRVLCPIDEAGSAFLRFTQSAALRFSLELRNRDFALFTDLTGLAPSDDLPTPLFSSSGAADGSGTESGAQLSLVTGQDTTRTPGIFADVEISLAAQTAGSTLTTASYFIRFAAKQLHWAYYCVTDLASTEDPLQIVDASPSGGSDLVVFSEANRRDLATDPDPTDSTAAIIASQYPTLHCVRLISDELIPCRQQPRKYLELRKGDERLVGPLPNPSLRQVARDDLLFQVIQYRTQPFLTQ